MGIQAGRNYIFGIEDFRVSSENILNRNRIDVVYEDSLIERKPFARQVASVVADDDIISEFEPWSRTV